MLQSFKKISVIVLLAFGLQTSWAFSLLGPLPGYPGLPANFGDAWQVSTIGYNPPGYADLGGPKNLGEAYRRNVQTYYYACDANFLNFFGSNGVVAIDDAFTIMNNCLTNGVDGYSSALTEFPLTSQSLNYDASALSLWDLKSETLGALVEQMGLANPLRFAWTLHDRYLPPGAPACAYDYLVVQRNYDITASPLSQVQYSPYVNGTLYSYFIFEACPASPPDPQALAVPIQVDPLQNPFTSVAGKSISQPLFLGNYINAGLHVGGFYTGLTRDDVAGLRYLLTTNNIAFESPATGSVLVNSSGPGGTNYGFPFVLYTSNYNAFAANALTNDPTTLSNLYPGLIITSYSYSFVVQKTPNIVVSTNGLIGAPAGTQVLVITTNGFTSTIVTHYKYTFGNLIVPKGFSSTNKNTTGFILTVQIYPLSGAPAGYLGTNISLVPVTLSGVPSGDYYIETNACGPSLIVSNLLTITRQTSTLIYATTNAAGWSFTQSLITTDTTHALVALPIVCGAVGGPSTTNSPGLYRGIGKVKFIPTSYDSLVGQFYQPITNSYSQTLVINSKPINQTFQRVITTPDFLMTAADLAGGPATPLVAPVYARSLNFNVANIAPNLAGPGTIEQPSAITFNKAGVVYENDLGGNQASASVVLAWGSFDGSSNAPVVYPNGTSIDNLANQILVQISPAALPVGTNHVVYPATTFVATGGAFSPPFTWSISQGALPSGLTLSSGGTISGTPAQTGEFDFTLELTDSLSRTVTWNYVLIIN